MNELYNRVQVYSSCNERFAIRYISDTFDLHEPRIHVLDITFGLNKGLFKDKWKSPRRAADNLPVWDDFFEFGKRLELPEKRIHKILAIYGTKKALVQDFVRRSFLNPGAKKAYLIHYNARVKCLRP